MSESVQAALCLRCGTVMEAGYTTAIGLMGGNSAAGDPKLVFVVPGDAPHRTLRQWRLEGPDQKSEATSIDQTTLRDLETAVEFDGRPYKLDDAFVQAVATAQHIQWLCVPDGTTPDHLRWIAELTRLRGLSLERAKLRDADLRPLQNLRSLQWLNLEGAELPPPEVSRLPDLPQLEVLIMVGVQPFEGHCDTVGQLPSLRALAAGRTVITDDGLRKLVQTHPQLRYLDISGPRKRITMASLPELAKLTELKTLFIGDVSYAEQFEVLDAMLPKLQQQLPNCWIYAGD